jgi:hypothetical protein
MAPPNKQKKRKKKQNKKTPQQQQQKERKKQKQNGKGIKKYLYKSLDVKINATSKKYKMPSHSPRKHASSS